jgi:hypothetical protein
MDIQYTLGDGELRTVDTLVAGELMMWSALVEPYRSTGGLTTGSTGSRPDLVYRMRNIWGLWDFQQSSGKPPETGRSPPTAPGQLLPLWQKSQFSLMAKGQNSHLVPGYHESIEGDITRLAVGNNQLAQFALDAPADKRVRRQIIDGRLNCCYGVQSGRWVLVAQELKRALDMLKRSCRIDYLRHGLGREVCPSTASLLIQACTSSARKTSPDFSISASAARASLIKLRICSSYPACRSTASTIRLWADRPVCLAREPSRARNFGGRRMVVVAAI